MGSHVGEAAALGHFDSRVQNETGLVHIPNQNHPNISAQAAVPTLGARGKDAGVTSE